jgi:hypothetical protein
VVKRHRPVLPIWLQYLLAIVVAAALVIGLVVFVSHNNGNGLATPNPKAEVRANQEAAVLVSQDQAPHVVRLRPHTRARAGLVGAVRADMTQRINTGQIDGQLDHVTCARRHPGPGYSCIATADQVEYDYLGVVDVPAHRVTYCRRDPPPVPSMNIPVSRRCTA